jgi:predicted metal-dependent HD superfamily phosphohydrolase
MADHATSPDRWRVGLLRRWHETISGPIDLAEEVLDRYAENTRHYHDLEHLTEVLQHVDELIGEADDPTAVRLAGWFHDVVYDVHRSDNEEASALLAESRLTDVGVGADTVAEVARLIRLTSTHAADQRDRNGVVLCDADLAILASPPERYDRYTEAVRREYAHVSDDDFSLGRASVLRQLLGLPQLFGTQLGRSWETAARANVERELAHLQL